MTHQRGRANGTGGLTLGRYVLARNGASLGGKGSLRNMLRRSLGAGSFASFWRYWNPIWGYYLGKYVFRPLNRILPHPAAVVLTFLVSGAIHDLVTTAVRGSTTLLFIPWFGLLGLGVLLSELVGMDLSARPWGLRAATNLTYIGACLWIAPSAGVR